MNETSSFDAGNQENKSCFPFFGLILFFVFVLVANTFQLVAALKDRSQLLSRIENFEKNQPGIDQAEETRERLKPIIEDLVKLAQTNKNAARVVREANIRVVNAPDGTNSPTQ